MQGGFFKVVSRSQCLSILESFPVLGREMVHIDNAHGRVLAGEVVAGEDLPPVSRSSMDGYAVRAADTFGAGETSPCYLDLAGTIEVSTLAQQPLLPGQCMSIVTGGSLPQGADSVVMVEFTDALGSGTIEVRKSVTPGENVMLAGEDISREETALQPGQRLRPQEIGLLAALGQMEVEVYRRPRVCVLSTGDELVPPHQTPLPGQIRDVNSHTVAALAAATGAVPLQSGIVPDDLDALVSGLSRGVQQADVVFLSGGSSVGVRDLTIQALDRLPGAEILVHGVAISPGKPTIVARVGSKCVFGLPGQVTSAQVVMLVLGEALLRHLEGEVRAPGSSRLQRTTAVMARNVASRQGREDYIRVRLTRQEQGPPLAHPLLGKSGLLRTLLQADGLVVIPAATEGLEQGETVLVRRL